MSYTKEKFGVDLEKKENWTPLLTYVHRSRFLWGLGIGLVLAVMLLEALNICF